MRSLILIAVICVTLAATAATTPTTTPADRLASEWWKQRHTQKVNQAKAGADLVFIGDSITQGWEGPGKTVWQKYYGARKALNLGFGGDKTENVLWRLKRGEMDGVKPKLVVLMIGTNNTGHRKDKPADIAAGVEAIVDWLRTHTAQSKILLLAIFPRGATPADKLRVNNDAANQLIEKLADNNQVIFLDISKEFLGPNGTLSKSVMPDLLHLNAASYEKWAQAIEPVVAKSLGTAPVR